MWNQTGPQGDPGPQGEQCPAGPAGSSSGYAYLEPTPVDLSTGNTVVAHLDLPDGRYILNYTASASAFEATWASCELSGADSHSRSLESLDGRFTDANHFGSLSGISTSSTGGRIELFCSVGPSAHRAQVLSAGLTAIEVRDLTQQ